MSINNAMLPVHLPKNISIDVVNIYRISQLKLLPRTIIADNGSEIFLRLLDGDPSSRSLLVDEPSHHQITLNTLINGMPELSYYDKVTNQYICYWYSKLCQQRVLKAYGIGAGFEAYRHLETYMDSGFPKGSYVVKPINGFRSFGILTNVVVGEKTKSLHQFLGLMAELDHEVPEDMIRAEKLVKDWDYKLLPVSENNYAKSMTSLVKEVLFIQEANLYADAKEYRIVKALDKYIICERSESREEEWTDYQQIIPLSDNKHFPLLVAKELKEFLHNFPFQIYGSIDLWVSHESKRWGVYEFQTQYGCNLIPPEIHRELALHLIKSVANGRMREFIDRVNKKW